MVGQEKRDEIVCRIVEAVEPEKIILFGSAARALAKWREPGVYVEDCWRFR